MSWLATTRHLGGQQGMIGIHLSGTYARSGGGNKRSASASMVLAMIRSAYSVMPNLPRRSTTWRRSVGNRITAQNREPTRTRTEGGPSTEDVCFIPTRPGRRREKITPALWNIRGSIRPHPSAACMSKRRGEPAKWGTGRRTVQHEDTKTAARECGCSRVKVLDRLRITSYREFGSLCRSPHCKCA